MNRMYRFSRRKFLSLMSGAVSAAALGACTSSTPIVVTATSTAGPAPTPTEKAHRLTISIVYTIITRYTHLKSPVWTMQFSEYALLWITFLGTAWIPRKGKHVKIDVIIDRLNPKKQRILNIFTSICGGVACLVAVWFSTETIWLDMQRGIFDVRAIFVPKFALYSVISLGYFLLSIQFIRNVYAYVRTSGKGTGE